MVNLLFLRHEYPVEYHLFFETENLIENSTEKFQKVKWDRVGAFVKIQKVKIDRVGAFVKFKKIK
jgi:hypothetical protein